MPVNYYIGLEENIRMPFKDRFLDGRNGAVANRPSKQASSGHGCGTTRGGVGGPPMPFWVRESLVLELRIFKPMS